VNGAEDPISGLVAELEEARALGDLYKQGWRPKRTIIYAAWDGEEPGLLGSTEWSETHADELREHAVAYINSDTNGRGFLGLEGSHTLEKMLNGVAKSVTDPETNVSVWRRMQAHAIADGDDEARTRADLRAGALGSGSDFSPFLQHLGIAAANLGFGGEDNGGIYHSAYDDFYWYTHFSDSTFVYGRALSQTIGTAVMRLASADVLPFAFTNLAETMGRYAKEIQDLRDQRAKQIEQRRKDVADSVYAVTRDPRNPLLPPKVETTPPRFEFAPVLNALDALSKAADDYEKAYASWLGRSAQGAQGDAAAYRALNQQLLAAERALTSPDGLPGRSWYQHLIYAPGLYTGYGVKTMAGAREAIEQSQWSVVDRELGRVAAAIGREADVVRNATKSLNALR
jgi:N-acetylated-alpha-linked acidic dipeptidase